MSDATPSAAREVRPDSLFLMARRWWIGALALGLGLGTLVGRLIPPPYADGQFWATFVTSAGFGGGLAVLGAAAASVVAWHNSRSDRAQKKRADDREQWWARFAWACEKAVSPEAAESDMGLSVLSTLLDETDARDEDSEMALNVLNAIAVANAEAAAARSQAARKRWWQR